MSGNQVPKIPTECNLEIRRPGSACTVFFSYVASKICHKIQNPKSPNSKIQNPQNPKSKIHKIPKLQNPPNLGRWGHHIKICYITVQNPKSKIPKIPKIQNPKSPKSKIPKIQNPKSEIPKSKIQNPPNPKSKIQNPPNLGPHKDLLHNGPKSKIQNPQNRPKKFGFWIGEFWILDFGPKIQNPKSPRSKIQNPKSPKSKIQNPQNPKSEIPKIQNPKSPKSPKSKIFRQNPKFGALGVSQKDLLHNDPKSKIQNPQNPKFGDFGFWILDSGDFGFWILGILDFGFGGFWILDLGDFGFWILGILDFGFWGFWILLLLVLLGRSRGCTTRQFGDGAWRSEARIPPGPPFRDSAKPTLSDIVGARKQIELQKPGAQEVKTIFYTFLHDF